MVVQESGFEEEEGFGEEEEGYGDESAGYDEAGCLNLFFSSSYT